MYNFDKAVNRLAQGSSKWQQMVDEKPDVSKDVYPFSVADVDFLPPPELVKSLQNFVGEAIFGYTNGTQGYYQAVIDWMQKQHNWHIEKDWIVLSPGVVPAIYNAIKTYTNENDGVIIMPPVYYPFSASINNTKRKLVENPLIIDSNGKYAIDFADLEIKASDPHNKMLIFCSPHNPVGRVWRKEELNQVAEICLKHNVLIMSDEIHFDLIMPTHKHHVLATLSEQIKNNVIVCTAPSKSFNLAGLQTSNIIIPNKQLRDQYSDYISKNGFHSLNIIGFKACEVVYTQCDEWLQQFIGLIYENHLLVKDFFAKYLPEIVVYDLEGTYLQWLDFRSLGLQPQELEKFLKYEAELFFDEGYIFGEQGAGFERINIACPTAILQAGLQRLLIAIQTKTNQN
ncbi:MalY/PatB family protein [Gilliamella sp. wkB112]|uniref:MalY/PatB family protein n=1 Tax=Gilliamella sp. wkB112 TaxID=3120257 RepID=UPI00080EC7C7|nr:MalY/PatB family protein [Gilliamella apicola]OCG01045.1 aminotransferase [Gilliamella apicola]